jgi:hypothetical protein
MCTVEKLYFTSFLLALLAIYVIITYRYIATLQNFHF